MKTNSPNLNGYAKYAWIVLLFNLGVILWGAFVRASGSGAGCGSHWPTCNGDLIPRAPAIETLIEFTHRITSGFALLLVVGLLIWAFRNYPQGHRVRKAAGFSMLFMVTEALVGAGLVLFEMVAYNDSFARAGWMAVHLANTFFLLASITLTAWWASGGASFSIQNQGKITLLLGLGLLGMLILAMSGGVTALGDTLFPSTSLLEGVQQDFSTTAHLLVRLRLWHPLIAVSVGLYLIITSILLGTTRTSRYKNALITLILVQLLAGLINVLLLAPIWMQMIHLLLADLVWIVLVLFSANTLSLGTIPIQESPQTKPLPFAG